jgi:hypothetical protein
MTKRDFFILIFKLFGLQAIGLSFFSVLPSVLSVTFRQLDAIIIIWTLIIIVIMVVICWSLLFEADKIVDLLRLTKGFTDDRIELGDIKAKHVIKTGTFIIGGLMIVSNIPELLGQVFMIFMGDQERLNFDLKDQYSLIVLGLHIVTGYLLITNLDFISRLLEEKK